MSDSEQGISQVQIAAAKTEATQANGLQKHHQQSVAHLDERITFFVLALSFIGLFVVWLSTSSALARYGSLGLVILITVLWGAVKIWRINKLQEERNRQVSALQTSDHESDFATPQGLRKLNDLE